MKRTTMFLDERLEKELQLLARERGTPVAMLVREALAAYVARERETPSLSFVGAGASGHTDTAERHEALLWREAREPGAQRAAARRRRKTR